MQAFHGPDRRRLGLDHYPRETLVCPSEANGARTETRVVKRYMFHGARLADALAGNDPRPSPSLRALIMRSEESMGTECSSRHVGDTEHHGR